MLNRRDLLIAGLLLPTSCRGVHGAPDDTDQSVWQIENGELRAVRRVASDQCYVPRIASGPPILANELEATLRLDDGGLLGIVVNSSSAVGPRYVVGLQSSQIRVFELMWPGRNWCEQKVSVSYGKEHRLRLTLLNEPKKPSRLVISLDDTVVLECQLPTRLESFHEPGGMAFDSLGVVKVLRVAGPKKSARVILPLAKPEPPERRLTLYYARGSETFGRWLQEQVREVRKQFEVPALACAVVQGKALIAAAVDGLRRHGSNTPVTLQDQFHVGSNTKSMTATLLARLIERNKLTWDTPLQQLLPDLADNMLPAYKPVPLGFVVHQASGILDSSEEGLNYAAEGVSLADQRTVRIRKALSVPPAFEPGAKHQYQNINFILAGGVIDRLADGETWEEAIKTRLFTPLGMKSVGYGPMGLPGAEMQPYGHVREQGSLVPKWADNHPSGGPAGTLHMNVQDFARYAQLHLSSEMGAPELLSLKSFRELHRPLHGYGKGWAVGGPDANGRYDLSHGGSNTMNAADTIIRPGRGVAVAVMANESPYGGGHGGDATTEIVKRVMDRL